MASGSESGARLIGVVGARGGIGASSLAAALARRLAQGRAGRARRPVRGARTSTTVALVDLDGAGGGLDVLLGIEEADGLRWPDLRGARGEVSGAELTSLLPRWSGVTVLSADRARPGAPSGEVARAVLDALRESHDWVVLDLDRHLLLEGFVAGLGTSGGSSAGLAPGGTPPCAVVLVVAGRELRSVAGLIALRGAVLAASGDVRLVVHGPAPGGLGVLELAHVVDLPVAASMGRQRGFAAALERGGGPVPPRGGPFARTVDRLVSGLQVTER